MKPQTGPNRYQFVPLVLFSVLIVGHTSTPRAAAQAQVQYTITDLSTLGGSQSAAGSINKVGQIAGFADTEMNQAFHAFRYANAGRTDLGTFGGDNSYAKGINDNGEIVGNAQSSGNLGDHAFLYSNGKMSDLGTLGGTASVATGINNGSQVVGWSYIKGTTERAFLYSGGKMTDLNQVIPTNSEWILVYASAINDTGQIVGGGINPAGENHAFLLTPVSVAAPHVAWLRSVQLLDGVVTLTGTNSALAANYPYYVRATPDPTLPRSAWPYIATNFFAADGSFTNSFDAEDSSACYLIEVPQP